MELPVDRLERLPHLLLLECGAVEQGKSMHVEIDLDSYLITRNALPQDSNLLNLGTGSVSWFEANGYGCKPTYNMTADDPIRPERVEGCLLDYELVEITHSGVQCALAVSARLAQVPELC